jgi:anthranilate synthase component II
VQQIERLAGVALRVVRNDAFEPDALLAEKPDAIVISPGPGTPLRAGRVVELIRADRGIPLLGVCLGHQAIGEAFGARVVRGALPVHGKVSEVRHAGARLFEGCPAPMHTARYHSLVVERATLPDCFTIDAETEEGAVMAISHKTRPIYGIQFHPESFGTVGGDRLILNFLAVCHPERESSDLGGWGTAGRTDRPDVSTDARHDRKGLR